jgi:hypothetical protein
MRERRVEKKGGREEWRRREGEKSGEEGRMIKWLGENGGELVGTKKYLCVQKRGSLCTN